MDNDHDEDPEATSDGASGAGSEAERAPDDAVSIPVSESTAEASTEPEASTDAAAMGKTSTVAAARRPPRAPTAGDRVRTVVRGIGQLLITLGVVILLFVVYELWFTDIVNAREQRRVTHQLETQWRSGDDPLVGSPPAAGSSSTSSGTGPHGSIRKIPLGTAIAIIRIPRLGLDYARTIVEGTNAADLDIGPGHYAGTAVPGAVGDFAVAGHRVGKGSPFLDLDKLQAGDPIIIETKDRWITYRMLPQHDAAGIPGREIVDPSDVHAIDPVPDHPGVRPTKAMITLTTCHPKFSARQRMIIHGVLAGTRPKSAGLPPALRSTS